MELHLLRCKPKVISKFIECNKFSETHTGILIKAVQSDSEKEFVDTGMNCNLKELGIRNCLLSFHTPQKNGIAVGENQTLIKPATNA